MACISHRSALAPTSRFVAACGPQCLLGLHGPARVDVDVDVERKQAQAIASLPDSITHYYAYSNEDITVISLRLPVP